MVSVKYFLDTEFIEDGPLNPIQLISIGLVCEDGREFYKVSSQFHPEDANAWVKGNVLPQLERSERTSLYSIGLGLVQFVNETESKGKPEFWGYYADYDWVVFCQIFGSMSQLPDGWPRYCRDLKQWCDELGNPQLPKQLTLEHDALNDARWNKEIFSFLHNLDGNLKNLVDSE